MPRSLVPAAAALSCLAVLACSSKPKAPPRETVLPQLQQEAQVVKADMEKIDPSLGVAVTWTIAGVDVKERPTDAERPWAGTIRFKVESRTREPDGSTAAARREKSFEYLYSVTAKKWQMQYSPGR
jgi:hypothetical protein